MLRCSCNFLTEEAFARAIKREEAKIATAPSLRKAAGIVFRSARDETGMKSEGCGNCVIGVIPDMIRKAGYFTDAPAEARPTSCDGSNCGKCKLPPLKL
jgi:hypothetical protein